MTTVHAEGIGEIRLGPLLGEGGEGRVFAVEGRDDVVAKLYSREIDSLRSEKIAVMARSGTPSLAAVAAWPLAPIFETPGEPVSGFVMPRVYDARPVHTLYTPKSRKAEFAGATWRFVTVVAANIARAFSVVHEHGLAVGDVNHDNVLVQPDARAVLIDCDTFHVVGPEREYPCGFGVVTYTPPELQGRSLTGVVRTANHDAFGLAVMVFQLLFLGRHPFSGRSASGNVTIEDAMAQRLFAYGTSAVGRGMHPPPFTPSLDLVPSEMAEMFERAFTSIADRPTSAEWAAQLTWLASATERCSDVEMHEYPAGLAACPWCAIERDTGTSLWHATASGPRAAHLLDVEALRSAIDAVAPPTRGAAPSHELATEIAPSPFARAESCRRRNVALRIAALSCAAMFLATLGLAGVPLQGALLAVLYGCCVAVAARVDSAPARHFRALRADAEHAWQSVGFRSRGDSLLERFEVTRRELMLRLRDYESLDTIRLERIAELERTSRTRQLIAFLEGFRVDDRRHILLDRGQVAALVSYGIETAADIKRGKAIRVPGILPPVAQRLEAWRAALEKRFVFDPNLPVGEEAIAAVDLGIDRLRDHLERELLDGPERLQRIVEQADRERRLAKQRADEARAALVLATADERMQPRSWTAPAMVSMASLLGVLLALLIRMAA